MVRLISLYEIGFRGDGKVCQPNSDVGCDILRNCDVNAQCLWNTQQSKYACDCNPGYKGNGLICKEDLLSCNILQNCGQNAECGLDAETRSFKCQCLPVSYSWMFYLYLVY